MQDARKSEAMKAEENQTKQKGFTLIELVIVIAIIGILAAFIVPRGGEVFKDAQVASVSEAVHSLKTAVAQYVVKQRTLPTTETQLIQNRYLEGSALATIAVGTGATLNNTPIAAACTPPAVGCYDLDGNGTADTLNSSVLDITITGVLASDAYAISKQLDNTLSTDTATADPYGRVMYTTPAGNPATTTVYVYVDSL